MNIQDENKEVVRAFVEEVFVKHDLSALERFMHDSYIQHNPDVSQGKEGFLEFFKQTFKAMPDFKYTLKKIVADGDFVWIYSTTTATHTSGEWLGVQPSGNKLDFDVVDMFRLEGGKLAEHWDVADTNTLFSQLGLKR